MNVLRPPGQREIRMHQELLDGRRQAYGWGLGGGWQYRVCQAPYSFHGIIDGLRTGGQPASAESPVGRTPDGRTPVGRTPPLLAGGSAGLPLYTPEYLAHIDPEKTAIVCLTDWRYFNEICEQARAYGNFAVIRPLHPLRFRQMLSGPDYARAQLRRDYKAELETLLGRSRERRHAAAESRGLTPEGPADRSESVTVGQDTDVPLKANGRLAIWNYALANGGAERQIVLLAEGLRSNGWEVDFITAYADHADTEGWAATLQQLGVRRTLLPSRRAFLAALENDGWAVALIQQFQRFFAVDHLHTIVATARHLRAGKFDGLICYLDYSNVAAGMAGVLADVPNIFLCGRNVAPTHFPTLKGFPIPKSDLKWMYHSLLGHSGVSFGNNSHAGARSYSRWLGIPQRRIAVLPNVVKLPARQGESTVRTAFRLGAAPIILGVMRLSEEKQPFIFLEVCQALFKVYPDARAILVGNGELAAELEVSITQRGLSDRIHMAGTQDDVWPFYLAANVLLSTSRMEGLPNVILEAQAAGCPVVATRVGGTPEAVTSVMQPYLVEAGDWSSMVAKASQLLDNPEQAAALGRAAAEEIKSCRSPASLAADTLAVMGLPRKLS